MAGPIAFLVPDPIQSTQLIPGGNTPASGGLLFVYQVGSTTKSTSYTDPSASTARTNPIVLDSGGNIPGNGEVWITSTAKFVLAPSNDTDPPSSPYWSKDNYPGINLITAAQVQALSAQSEWVQGSTATFVGVTGFSVVGDQTALYTLGRRVKATVTGGDRFGIVTSAVLSTGSTAVGVTLDSGTLNGGLSVISYGILSTLNGSVPWSIETSTGVSITGNIITAYSLAATTAITTSFTAISTATFQNLIDISATSAGIRFAATTNANASTSVLDDYRETTSWVSGISFGGVSTGVTYIGQTGTAIKIGRYVHASAIVSINATGTATGSLDMAMPYPVKAGYAGACAISWAGLNSTWINIFLSFPGATASSAAIQGFAAATTGARSQLTVGDIKSQSAFQFTVTYESQN